MKPCPTKSELGSRIADLRRAAGYRSAKAFAERIGLKPTAYVEYEQGRRSLSYETAWLIADALRITLDEVGGREGKHLDGQDVLSQDERVLLSKYRSLTPGRRDSVQDTVDALAAKSKASEGASEAPCDVRLSA